MACLSLIRRSSFVFITAFDLRFKQQSKDESNLDSSLRRAASLGTNVNYVYKAIVDCTAFETQMVRTLKGKTQV